MKSTILFVIGVFLIPNFVAAEEAAQSYTLRQVIEFALKNEPGLAGLEKGVKASEYDADIAKGARWPKIDLGASATRYRYPSATSPISGPPQSGGFPEFDSNIYEAGFSLKIPVYRGGRLVKNQEIAEIAKAIEERNFSQGKQELVYNLTSVYCKILELEALLKSRKQMVTQLEEHHRVTGQFVKAGTAAQVDLMKTGLELAHAGQQELATRNSIATAYALLRSLMGADESYPQFTINGEPGLTNKFPQEAEAVYQALQQRPEYQKAKTGTKLRQARLELVNGKMLPTVDIAGEFSERAGDSLSFKENWNIGLKLAYPLFDGGIMRAEAKQAAVETERSNEELRAVRLRIIQEVKEAYLSIADAEQRLLVAREAIGLASENLRVEQLKYQAGAGTTRDVIDAQTALLRANSDLHKASYDLFTSRAALERAMGSSTDIKREVALQ